MMSDDDDEFPPSPNFVLKAITFVAWEAQADVKRYAGFW
jgi:hypothetical protein